MPLCKNLASGKLASNISASTTSISVYVGSGSSTTIKNVWPSTPFYVTIMPDNPVAGVPNSLDSEIVKVTAVGTSSSNTTLTVTRGQRNTTAKAFTAGAIVSNASYADDTVLQDDDGSEEVTTPFITGQHIVRGTITDLIYPVGSIYISATLSTPEQVTAQLGGTWIAWGAGRVPVGVDTTQTEFDTVEETGGNKTHTHEYGFQFGEYFATTVLRENSNAGIIKYNSDGTSSVSGPGSYVADYSNKVVNNNATSSTKKVSASHYKATGNAKYTSTLQPYITVYMWKRTA